MALFDVGADTYARFMGRFSAPLAPQFAAVGLRGVSRDARVLDVGCGPGMLTCALAQVQGEARVSAVDPVEGFVMATEQAYPLADVHLASAEKLPFADGTFGAALAQLVVGFMADPVAGVREMVRVTVDGGRVSACFWDHAGGRGALSPFWRVLERFEPDAGEAALVGAAEGDLLRVLTRAGLREVEETELTVTLTFETFEEWWQPFTLGVGPAGAYVGTLNRIEYAGLVDALRQEHGDGPMTVEAVAWTATGLV